MEFFVLIKYFYNVFKSTLQLNFIVLYYDCTINSDTVNTVDTVEGKGGLKCLN